MSVCYLRVFIQNADDKQFDITLYISSLGSVCESQWVRTFFFSLAFRISAYVISSSMFMTNDT